MDSTQIERTEILVQESSITVQREKKVRQLLGGLTVFLLTISQVYLYTTPIDDNIIVPRSFLYGLLGLVLLILSQRIPIPKSILSISRLSPPAAWWCICAAIFFAVLTTFAMVSFKQYGRVNYMPVLSLWAISGLFYISAFPLPRFSIYRPLAWIKTHRVEFILLLLITLLAAALRFYRLGSIPRVINGDEGMIGMLAQSTTSGDLANPFALNSNIGGLYLQVLNLFITLFHPSAFSIRLPSAIGGVLSILASYLLARKVFGNRVALLSVVLIAFSHTHISFSRTLTGYIQDTWLIPLEVFLLLDGLEKRRSWQTALSGMVLAVHFTYYLTAPPVVAILVGYLLLCFVFHRRWFRTVLPQVGAFGGGLIILLIPALYYYIGAPNEFMARLRMEGTFHSGWLSQTVLQTGNSAIEIIFSRITHAFLSLIYYPSLDFYGSPIPMLSMITSVLFLVGLGFALLKIKNRSILLSLCILFGFVIFIGVFAIPPAADSYRIVVILPFAMILAALGIDSLFDLFGLHWQRFPIRYVSASGILVILLFLTNMQIYFGDFYGRCQFGGDQTSRFASYLGSYVGKFDPSTTVNLLSDEFFFYGSHPSVDFLSGSHPITNIAEPVSSMSFPSGDIVIASPNRIHELKTWIDAHPGGKAEYVYDCKNTILLGYELP